LEGIDREDMMVEVEVVKREYDGVVLMRHWTGNGVKRHQRARQEWKELVKSGCPKGPTTFVSRNSNWSTWRRVKKGEEESENKMKYM
jgi:hypothetical protein